MPPKRSNKTARVLNLITKPDTELSDVETNSKDIIDSNNNMSEDAIADLLAKHNEEQNEVKEDISKTNSDSNAVLSDDAIANLFAENSQGDGSENNQSEQSNDDNEQESEVSAELPPAPQPVVPILQNVREQESQLEDQICSDLLSSLELEEQNIKTQPNPESENTIEKAPEPTHEPTDSNAVLSDDAIAALFAQNNDEPEKAPEPTHEPADSNTILSDDAIAALFAQNNQEPESNPQPVENNVESKEEKKNDSYFCATAHGKRSVRYVNVIQELVEEEAEYSSQMLACRCPRCIADMKALTLTNLPSKYVVIDEDEKNGILRIYASKYSRLISVQIMKSCVIVNENPHH